jgi:hypothetical protein
MFSNVFAILSNEASKPWSENPNHKKVPPFLYVEATCGFLRDSLFNLAHWIFCFKYWLISIEM